VNRRPWTGPTPWLTSIYGRWADIYAWWVLNIRPLDGDRKMRSRQRTPLGEWPVVAAYGWGPGVSHWRDGQ
jgi:hypothetical protein